MMTIALYPASYYQLRLCESWAEENQCSQLQDYVERFGMNLCVIRMSGVLLYIDVIVQNSLEEAYLVRCVWDITTVPTRSVVLVLGQ